MSNKRLHLEILSGPLDGRTIKLESETTWSQAGERSLDFPWDIELGTPQARFFIEGENWWLEAYTAVHGTYCVNRVGRIEEKLHLEMDDVLKASETWLRVTNID